MKKVLIITYYWPPSGGSGVQRWLKFSKYLPDFGWQPIIFTPENPDFNIQDISLLKDISSDTKIIKYPIWEPYKILDFLKGKRAKRESLAVDSKKKSLLDNLAVWIRGNLLIPDPRVFWVSPSSKFLYNYLRKNPVDAIVTTSPPHSMHLVGLRIKQKLNIKWIVDFRDPWSDWDLLKKFKTSKLARNKHKKLEKKVVNKANHVITVSDNWANNLSQRYKKDVTVITNGFDTHDFQVNSFETKPKKFRITHVGLLSSFRNPQLLWKALRALIKENKLFGDDLEIYLAGMVDEDIKNDLQGDPVLRNNVRLEGYISHSELMKVYTESPVLLVLQNQTENVKGHIPGKIFEYLASNKYILGIGDPQSDAAKIVQTTKAGIFCNFDDEISIKNAINDFYIKFKSDETLNNNVVKYTRKNLTRELVKILEQSSD